MKREMTSIIRWLPSDRGGRKAPPPDATGYTAPVRLESDPSGAAITWSLRIVRSVALRGPECILAQVRFVVDEAPHHLLREGERFELQEGARVVAKGVVLPASVQVPPVVNDFELALLG